MPQQKVIVYYGDYENTYDSEDDEDEDGLEKVLEEKEKGITLKLKNGDIEVYSNVSYNIRTRPDKGDNLIIQR